MTNRTILTVFFSTVALLLWLIPASRAFFHHAPFQRQSVKNSLNNQYTFARITNQDPTSTYPPSTTLSMVASSSSSSSVTHTVIFQQVIRPPPTKRDSDNTPAMFLATLVEYIQSHFQLPNGLPMIYERQILDGSATQQHSILCIDSPLSRNSDMTRMDVEVVGIYPNDCEFPTMAMVVVKKPKDINQADKNDIMMTRMFEDSERKILTALEKGLEDYSFGKINVQSTFTTTTTTTTDGTDASSESGEDRMWSSLDDFEGFDSMDEFEDLLIASHKKSKASNKKPKQSEVSKHDISRDENGDVVINTTSEEVQVVANHVDHVDTKNAKKQATREKKATEKIKTSTQSTSSAGDFAVEAAKRIARDKSKVKPKETPSVDFAVEAAKVKAKTLKTVKSIKSKEEDIPIEDSTPKEEPKTCSCCAPAPPKSIVKENDNPIEIQTPPQEPSAPLPSAPLPLRRRKGAGAFRVSISNPDEYTKRQTDKAISKRNTPKKRKINVVKDDSFDGVELTEKKRKRSFDNIQFNQKVVAPSVSNSNSSSKQSKSDEDIEHDIMKAAIDLMPGEISNDGQEGDISPEELLKNILKFGEEQEEEEKPGVGFVTGAFAKAKELTKEEKKVSVGLKDPSSGTEEFLKNIKVEEDDSEVSEKKLSAEQELKNIFAAGERLVDSRISIPDKRTQTPSQLDDDRSTEDLINADKTVPRNARSLDEDLAELEVRISRSPGEDTEAYGPNAVFDVFSGPEVYNPNVDPENAVNWPGALPGTRTDIMLPPELAEAVKNAKYAASILSKIIEQDGNLPDSSKKYVLNGKAISREQVQKLQTCVDEGIAVGLIPDPIEYLEEKGRLQMLLDEMNRQPEERHLEVASIFKDLLLSDNLVTLMRGQLQKMAMESLDLKRNDEYTAEAEETFRYERQNLGRLINYTQLLLKEVRALGAELEASQLEVIRSICHVAMDPKHTTEEETAEALTDAVRDMRPLLDEHFVAYLKYAVGEEEGRLARSGVLDDPDENRWLFVLKIVQEGVYAELAKGVQRYVDHISYVLRMESKKERKELLSEFIDVLPSMDVRPFVKVVDNIAASLGSGVKGEFDTGVLGSETNKILQLRRDVHQLLPPERIQLMSGEADEWASQQRRRLMELREGTQQRLKAARETQSFDDDLPAFGRGEIERMT